MVKPKDILTENPFN